MTERARLRTTRKVAEVRDLQRIAAEAAVQQAAAARAAHESRHAARSAELEDLEQAWATSLAGPRLDLQMTGAWTNAVWVSERAVQEASEDLTRAADQETESRQAWRGAVARAEAADDLVRRARRALGRRLEEDALNEVADRTARGRPIHEG